jgi:hypothetical protein
MVLMENSVMLRVQIPSLKTTMLQSQPEAVVPGVIQLLPSLPYKTGSAINTMRY